MGRRTQQQKKKEAVRAKHVEWIVSEGQRGRNPGVSAAMKRARQTGIASRVRDMEISMQATSTKPDSAQYPGPWLKRRIQVASTSEVADLIDAYEAEDNVPHYGIAVETNVKSGPQPVGTVDAPGLVYFALKGSGINAETKVQIIALLEQTVPQNLVVADISMSGKLQKGPERASYQLLGRSNGTLTHLRLQLPFYDKEGLLDYLCSPGAAHLISLELQTNGDVLGIVAEALKCPSGHRLPNLRQLCLRLKKNNVNTLFEALKERRLQSPTVPNLIVEIRADVDDATYAQARNLGIIFKMPPVFPAAFNY
ncbi:hypothetical protein EV121DRAFT_213371 [Schizophyllum commune]